MRETLDRLRSLQELDEDLYRVKTELKRLPEERARRRSGIDAAQHQLQHVEHQIKELKVRIKEIEDLTTTQRQRMRKLESEAASSRGDTALIVAFQHEMRTLKRQIGEAEEEGLGLVEQADALGTQRDEILAAIEQEEAQFAEYSGNIETEMAAAQEKKDGLAAERASRLSDGIAPEILTQYEKLLDAREGQAMAMLENRTCQGCYTSVPSNVYVRLARGMEIVTCPSCTRILYLPE